MTDTTVTNDRSPRATVEGLLDEAAEIYREHGDGPAFQEVRARVEELGEVDVFDVFAGEIERGEESGEAIQWAMSNIYDAPRIEAGECHPGDLAYYREWFEDVYGHDGSEEDGDPDGPVMSAWS